MHTGQLQCTVLYQLLYKNDSSTAREVAQPQKLCLPAENVLGTVATLVLIAVVYNCAQTGFELHRIIQLSSAVEQAAVAGITREATRRCRRWSAADLVYCTVGRRATPDENKNRNP